MPNRGKSGFNTKCNMCDYGYDRRKRKNPHKFAICPNCHSSNISDVSGASGVDDVNMESSKLILISDFRIGGKE